MYNITFYQIMAFLTAAKYQNLSTAAERMFISQPALSRTLRRFEESVGFQVFTRSNAGAKLTREGEYLFSALEPLYNNISVVLKSAKNIASQPKKKLQIIQPISYDAVEDFDAIKAVVREYTRTYPDVDVAETLHDFQQLRQQLEYGAADIVISQDFGLVGIPSISHKVLGAYNMYIAISEHHRLAEHDDLRAETLTGETLFIVEKTGTAFDRESALMLYGQMGFTLGRIEFVPNFLTLLHTLRHRKGFSICGRFSRIGIDDIKYYPISQAQNPARIVAAWRSNKLSAEARDFIDMLPSMPGF